MAVANLLGLMLRCSELEARSDTIVQQVFCNQVLPPVVFTKVTIQKYAAGLVCYKNCARIPQSLLDRL